MSRGDKNAVVSCEVCDVEVAKVNFEVHKLGKKHQRKLFLRDQAKTQNEPPNGKPDACDNKRKRKRELNSPTKSHREESQRERSYVTRKGHDAKVLGNAHVSPLSHSPPPGLDVNIRSSNSNRPANEQPHRNSAVSSRHPTHTHHSVSAPVLHTSSSQSSPPSINVNLPANHRHANSFRDEGNGGGYESLNDTRHDNQLGTADDEFIPMNQLFMTPVIDVEALSPFCMNVEPNALIHPVWWSKGPARPGKPRMEPIDDLSQDVIRFHDYFIPTRAERRMRSSLLKRLRALVVEIWPKARVEVFGSYAADTFLPMSDIDLCIMGVKTGSPLHTLATSLRRNGYGDRMQLITRARVPIIKLVDHVSGCPIDICFNQPTGPNTTRIVKRFSLEFPAFKPILRLIKYYLTQRQLNEVYSGGLGSYGLAIMLVSFLQHHELGRTEDKSVFGTLLIDFLQLYGSSFNYYSTGISVLNGGSYFNKGSRGWHDELRPYLLALEDPNDTNNDIGRNSFSILAVRAALMQAYQLLTANGGTERAMLSSMLYPDPIMVGFRARVQHLFDQGLFDNGKSSSSKRSNGSGNREDPYRSPSSSTSASATSFPRGNGDANAIVSHLDASSSNHRDSNASNPRISSSNPPPRISSKQTISVLANVTASGASDHTTSRMVNSSNVNVHVRLR